MGTDLKKFSDQSLFGNQTETSGVVRYKQNRLMNNFLKREGLNDKTSGLF